MLAYSEEMHPHSKCVPFYSEDVTFHSKDVEAYSESVGTYSEGAGAYSESVTVYSQPVTVYSEAGSFFLNVITICAGVGKKAMGGRYFFCSTEDCDLFS